MATILLIDDHPDDALATDLEAAASCLVHRIPAHGLTVPMICAEINAIDPVAPLLIACTVADASILPAIALAQRAAHRRIEGYVLIEPIRVATGDNWPEAPVFVTTSLTSPDAVGARLRGWTIVPADTVIDQVNCIINAVTSVG